jgi:hypothetical protein
VLHVEVTDTLLLLGIAMHSRFTNMRFAWICTKCFAYLAPWNETEPSKKLPFGETRELEDLTRFKQLRDDGMCISQFFASDG